MQLARDMPGLVGADLCNVVNEAQLNAVRAGRDIIQARDMYAGIDRFAQVGGVGHGAAVLRWAGGGTRWRGGGGRGGRQSSTKLTGVLQPIVGPAWCYSQ